MAGTSCSQVARRCCSESGSTTSQDTCKTQASWNSSFAGSITGENQLMTSNIRAVTEDVVHFVAVPKDDR